MPTQTASLSLPVDNNQSTRTIVLPTPPPSKIKIRSKAPFQAAQSIPPSSSASAIVQAPIIEDNDKGAITDEGKDEKMNEADVVNVVAEGVSNAVPVVALDPSKVAPKPVDDDEALNDDEEFFQPEDHDDTSSMNQKSATVCRRIDDDEHHNFKVDARLNIPIVNMSKLSVEESSFMDCFTLYNSCLDKNNFIVIQAKDDDEIPSHLGSLSTEWFGVRECNVSAPSRLANQRVSIPLSIRPLMRGENTFANIPYDECSNGLIILSEYLESFGHTYYVVSQLLSLFQRKVITSAVSLIPVSGLSSRLEAFQKGLFSLLPIYRLVDWSLSVKDATVKRGTREFVRKYDTNATITECFKKLEICRICSKDNLPGVLDSATKLGMLAQNKYGTGYPQDSGYQKWQSINDTSAGHTLQSRPGVHVERGAPVNSSNWRGLPKLVLTIVQKQNSLGKIVNLVDILYFCGKGVVLNTTDTESINKIQFASVNVDSTTDRRGLVVLICRVHEVGKRLLDDLQITATTDILLGIHGEGLINALFIRPSGHLIELRPCGVLSNMASKYEKMADYQSKYAWRFFWLVKYVSNSLCGTFNNHEHNVVLPIDKLRSLLIKIATVKNDRNNYVNYYQKNQHIVTL